MRSSFRAVMIVAACALSQTANAISQERLFRRFDWRDGLPVTIVRSVAQDADGFLWIATRGGVARFDGTKVQIVDRANAEFLHGSGEHGIFWRSVSSGSIWQARRDQGAQVIGPTGAPTSAATSGVIASDGALWLVLERRLWRRDPSGRWSEIQVADSSVPPESLRAIRPARDGQVFLAHGDVLSIVTRDGSLTHLATVPGGDVAVALEDGRFLVGTRDGAVLELNRRERHEIASGGGRVLDIAVRGTAWWVLSESSLTVFRHDRPPQTIGMGGGWIGTGGLLVDRDGGLWCGTAQGLLHFPEPDTVAWSFAAATADPGAVEAARSVLFSPAGAASPVLFRRGMAGWLPATTAINSTEPGCVGAEDQIWIVQSDTLVERLDDGTLRRHHLPGLSSAGRCSVAADGARWIGTNIGIVLAGSDAAPKLFPGPPGSRGGSISLYEAPSGELFAGPAAGDLACHALAGRVRHNTAEWKCDPVDGAGRFNDFIELPGGEVWAATTQRGIMRLRAGVWEPLGQDPALSDREISSLAPARAGGVWIAGPGIIARVAERRDVSESYEEVESLGVWQGLTSVNIADVVESSDGTLWLAAPASVIEVPLSARSASLLPPKVELVEVTVDGEVIRPPGKLELRRGWRRMSLRFAAMSYRDPSLLRYRIRLHPHEPWQAPTAVPLFRFTATSPGDYAVEVQASLDQHRWSEAPAQFRFRVPRPWHRSPWFILLAVAAGVVALFALLQMRLAIERRLSRQRARIARDLHDHLGSGLGSIGLLAGIVSRPEVASERRTDLGAQIKSVASELSTALSDIVWSLKPGEASLASLTRHLMERGTALFPHDNPRLQFDIPAPLPHQRLSLAVRRNVLLIALEALHNAARHSGATTVRLTLASVRRGYSLSIVDDGKGMKRQALDRPRGSEPGGMGLLSMRIRAREIGADLSWTTLPEGGTEVRLVFSPRAEGRTASRDPPVA